MPATPGWIVTTFVTPDGTPWPGCDMAGFYGSASEVIICYPNPHWPIETNECPGMTPSDPRPVVLAHEIGHAMGYFHVSQVLDGVGRIMTSDGGHSRGRCVTDLSDIELFHSRIVYSRPVGNLDPDTDPSQFSLGQ